MTHSADNQLPPDESEQNKKPVVDDLIAPPTSSDLPKPILESDHKPGMNHPTATAIGAVGGAVAGAAIGKAIGGQKGAVVGAVGGIIGGAVIGDQVGEYANPSLMHVVPLRDEEAAFVWRLQQADQSQWVWELCPKETGTA